MAKKTHSKTTTSLNLGDRVRIKDLAGQVGRIIELRGPLGPGGAPVYRVRVRKTPQASYIELLADQLELLPTTVAVPGQIVPAKRSKTAPNVSRGSAANGS